MSSSLLFFLLPSSLFFLLPSSLGTLGNLCCSIFFRHIRYIKWHVPVITTMCCFSVFDKLPRVWNISPTSSWSYGFFGRNRIGIPLQRFRSAARNCGGRGLGGFVSSKTGLITGVALQLTWSYTESIVSYTRLKDKACGTNIRGCHESPHTTDTIKKKLRTTPEPPSLSPN